MKLKVCILAALAVLVVNAEDRQPAKTATKAAKKSAPATTPPADLTLPPGAVQIEPGAYAYTDAKGKKWLYRKTPFGLARMEDKPVDTAAASAPKGPPITATEAGDVIKFERPGPFGPYRWEKKKSDLAEDERAAWERSKQSTTSKAKE